MATLSDLAAFSTDLKNVGTKMPVLFMGHGSPMNGIEENPFSGYWKKLGNEIPSPLAILCISAHWLTRGTFVTAMDHPKTIHDFGGFPPQLYKVQYSAPGNPGLAREISDGVTKTSVGLTHEWGLDHGCWTILRHIYPNANIPVLQLSIDYGKPASYHYNLAHELRKLREKGVLIIGSGNMVHNLGLIAWEKISEPEYGYDWAIEINLTFKKLILSGEHEKLINYNALGTAAKLAIPSPDHYLPLIYTLGLKEKSDSTDFFNDKCVAGSLTMTSVSFRNDL